MERERESILTFSQPLTQHDMLSQVPAGYRLWIIAKMNRGEGRPRYTFWLQKREDRRVVLWYKGLQELYTALGNFSEETEPGQGGRGEGMYREQGQPGKSEQEFVNDVAAARSLGEGQDVALVTAAEPLAGRTEGGCDDDGAVGEEGVGTRDPGLVLPTNWGRCCRLLKESEDFILKGDEKEDYLRLHPEIAPVPSTYMLHVVAKPISTQARCVRVCVCVCVCVCARARVRACVRACVRRDEDFVWSWQMPVLLLAPAEEGHASAEALQQHRGTHRSLGSLDPCACMPALQPTLQDCSESHKTRTHAPRE